jgi:hypothetical protein
MYMSMGIAELYIAEWFCNGTPLGDASTALPISTRPLEQTSRCYNLALAHFDTALAARTTTDTRLPSQSRTLLSVGKGRVLLELGKFPEAARAWLSGDELPAARDVLR